MSDSNSFFKPGGVATPTSYDTAPSQSASAQVRSAGTQIRSANTQGHLANTQGHLANTQGHLANTQGHPTNIQPRLSERSSSAARMLLPFEEALRLQILPLILEQDGSMQTLYIAVSRGMEEEGRIAVRFHTGLEVSVIPVSSEILLPEIFAAYKGDTSLLQALPEAKSQTDTIQAPARIVYDRGTGDTVRSLAALIDYAIARQISDIHITPLVDGVKVRARKNGMLLEREDLIGDSAFHAEIVNRLKVLINAPAGTSAVPLDGSFAAGTQHNRVRIRVSLMPSVHGENVVLRILDSSTLLPLSALGYEDKLLRMLESHTRRQNGLLIVSGSTGSGKTTALYALVQSIAARNRLVHTLEDPIEKTVPGIVQTEVHPARGVTYQKLFPALLRQDPDCIMLGELRDADSARAIVTASLTGHCTVTSVHGQSVSATLKRFEQFGISLEELQAGLAGVFCQRLLPLLCHNCKVMDLQQSKRLHGKAYRAVGCSICEYTGYHRRIPVVESFFPTESWRSNNGSFEVAVMRRWGMYSTFEESASRLVKQGLLPGSCLEEYF